MPENLETRIIHVLAARKQTLATAESCTGGYIAHLLTNAPGASEVFSSGIVSYSNRAKEEFLGVSSETLARNGAVSEPVAREMAEGARRACRTDYAVSATGIAGPSGGTAEMPVGTVFIGIASPLQTLVMRQFNPGERLAFKETTARQALEQLLAMIERNA